METQENCGINSQEISAKNRGFQYNAFEENFKWKTQICN